jgi:S1-C subfamily serine protease
MSQVEDDVTTVSGEAGDAGQTGAPTDDVTGEPAEAGSAAPPPPRMSRSQRRNEWRQVERARRYAARRSVRFPIFTRSILLWMLIFALCGVAFGASGAFWWAHFNTEVNQLRDDTRDFEQRAQGALSAIDAQRNEALRQIREVIKPVEGELAKINLIKLAERFSPSVWQVTTRDEEGKPTTGTAFSVATLPDESLMVTSYSVVRAATLTPGPGVSIRKGSEEVTAELWAVDPERDLALLRVERGEIPVLEWASDDQQARALGTSVFAITAVGGNGASMSTGTVLDLSAAGIQHDAALAVWHRGGPMITPDGKVLAVASLSYNPIGIDGGAQIHFAPPVNGLCIRVLICGGGINKHEREKRAKQAGLPPPKSDSQFTTEAKNPPGR